jgi:L-Ala-D/L-Glu epimerase / N-acetyl-D-glutamate racemase
MRVFKDAYADYTTNDFVLVKIETDEGLVGYGEAPSSVTVGFYGETLETVTISLRNHLGPSLIGLDPLNITKATRIMDIAQGNSFIAKTAISVALYDLMGKALKVPVNTILGGKQRETIRAASEISITEPKTMAEEARRLLDLGFRVIKLKAGRNAEEEVKGLKMVRDVVGHGIELRLDPNAGWSRAETLRLLPTIERCEVSYLEQPLPGWDLTGMAAIRKAASIPLMVDESVWTPQDVVRVAHYEAADIVNIKTTKTQGLKKALEIYSVASAFGMPCIVGCELESCVNIAAKLHLASALESLPYACEYTELAFSEQLIKQPLKVENGSLRVPSGPGLGVDPDADLIAKYAS